MKIVYPQNYLVWDLETSGLKPDRDQILEVAFMKVVRGEIVEEYSAILNHPGLKIDPEAAKIHGIDEEKMAKEGLKAYDVIEKLVKALQESHTSVTHNGTNFDLQFLWHMYMRYLMLWGRQPEHSAFMRHVQDTGVDTAALVKAEKLKMPQRWNERPHDYYKRVLDTRAPGVKFNLGLCCDENQIDRSQIIQHRAGGDIILTNELYKKLCLS